MRPTSIRFLSPADYRRTPWKNGGGVTIDIADEYLPGAPAGGWDAMVWRFGRTRIVEPGPFSDLSGFDRLLAVIDGSGLVLHPEGAPPLDVRQPFRPVRFPGDWRIVSELTAGPVGVMNLLADRRMAKIDLRFLRAAERWTPPPGVVIVHAPAGDADAAIDGAPHRLAADHALRLETSGDIEVATAQGLLAVASILRSLG